MKLSCKNLFIVSFVLMIIIQVVLAFVFWNVEQQSDAELYISLAEKSYINGTWYPSYNDISDIVAPGLINFLIIQLKLFGTLKANIIINILLNIGIILFIYKIGCLFFNKNISYIGTSLYCLLYSNWFLILNTTTEIPFLFLALLAFLLCMRNRWWPIILAAALFAIANWIRPISIMFIVPIVFLFLLKNRNVIKAVVLPLSYITIVFAIGYMTERGCGIFTSKSITSGANLLMTANDQAYGGVQTYLFNDPASDLYVEDRSQYNAVELDSIYKDRAILWIKNHPIKYLGLYFKKIPAMFVEDSWSDRIVLGGAGKVSRNISKLSISDMFLMLSDRFVKSIIYYICLILSLVALFSKRKELFNERGILVLMAVLCVGGSCIFSVGPRYHYPMTFIVTLFAAYFLYGCRFFQKIIRNS